MATRELQSAPHILPLYARAAAPLVPGASRLPFVGGGGGEIPELELVLAPARIDHERVAAYARVCSFPERRQLPATYPHVLAFPLHMTLMTDGRFPFGAVGLVHLANSLTQHRPIGADEQLQLRVCATPLQEHPRGRTFSLLSEARSGSELVWEECSTMLTRGRRGTSSAGREESLETVTEPFGERWQLPGDLGRRYAAVSGDRNPIHLHALSARMLGFPRAIAHGMWTKARCLAALQSAGRLPDAFRVEVRFRRPILLPAAVGFASVADADATRFSVRDTRSDTIHLDGRVEPTSRAANQGERTP
jgi:acyl dehydratase